METSLCWHQDQPNGWQPLLMGQRSKMQKEKGD